MFDDYKKLSTSPSKMTVISYMHDFINKSYGLSIALLAIAWAAMGLVAFVYSLFCMAKTPSLMKGIFGVVLAILTGPLFFVYWYIDKDYCRMPYKVSP